MRNWVRADALLDELLDLGPEEQVAHLDLVCHGDKDLRSLLEGLLAADVRAAAAFDSPGHLVSHPVGTLPTDESVDELAQRDDSSADRFGAYHVIRVLGEGGMGKVYLAERKHGDQVRRVAIKTIRDGSASTEALWRFKREREALARLEHSHIARLYDSGTTSKGTPYLVMEYVEGESIGHYCDLNRLTIDQRLRLFSLVCEAVQAAHQDLLVHRDLKPSNILVTSDGEPKLIDFGIAKTLHASTEDGHSQHTKSGVLPLTPKYASPEQLCGKTVATTSDVYALGVTLYLLLCGQEPYAFEGLSLAEMSSRIAEGPHQLPSHTTAADGAHRRAVERGTSTKGLRRQLSGDLDQLVLKAIAFDPANRYQSAGALAHDIRNHRLGFPISAASENVFYRTTKWLGRHRAAVSVAGMLIVLLAAFVATLLVAHGRTDQARLRAEQVSQVLVTVLQRADPTRSQGAEVPVGEVLQHGLMQIEQDLGEEPEVQADLYVTLARIYHGLGEFEAARSLAARSLKLRLEFYDVGHQEIATSRFLLGRYQRLLGQADEAEPFLLQAVESRLRHYGKGEIETIEAQVELATCLRYLGKYNEALVLLEGIEVFGEKTLRESPERRAAMLDELGMVLLALGRPADAAPPFATQLSIFQRHLKPPHTSLAHAQSQLGLVLEQLGDWAGAVELYRSTVKIESEIYGPDHPELASSLNNLGSVLDRLGDYAAAEKTYRRVIEIDRATLGNKHPYLAISLNNLASLLMQSRGARAAVPLFQEALAIESETLGEKHPETASTRTNLASAFTEQGQFGIANQQFHKALQVQLETLGSLHRSVGNTHVKMARLSRLEGNFPEANRRFRAALEVLEPIQGSSSTDFAFLQLLHAEILHKIGDVESARDLHNQARRILASQLPASHPHLARADLAEAAVLLSTGQAVSAEQLARAALLVFESGTPDGVRVAEARHLIGVCLNAQGRLKASRVELATALAWSRANQGKSSPLARAIQASLARLP